MPDPRDQLRDKSDHETMAQCNMEWVKFFRKIKAAATKPGIIEKIATLEEMFKNVFFCAFKLGRAEGIQQAQHMAEYEIQRRKEGGEWPFPD